MGIIRKAANRLTFGRSIFEGHHFDFESSEHSPEVANEPVMRKAKITLDAATANAATSFASPEGAPKIATTPGIGKV